MIGALDELSPYMLGFCLNMRFKGRVLVVYIVLVVYMRTQFRGLCLSPLSRALGQLSKYEIKKGGHFILRQSL